MYRKCFRLKREIGGGFAPADAGGLRVV